MGRSRVQRQKQAPTRHQSAAQPTSIAGAPKPIAGLDIMFGGIEQLPAQIDIPAEFWRSHHPCADFVSKWFFSGLNQSDLARLEPRAGVDTNAALRVISCILRSFAPKHEHKEAGTAMLLDRWFVLKDSK